MLCGLGLSSCWCDKFALPSHASDAPIAMQVQVYAQGRYMLGTCIWVEQGQVTGQGHVGTRGFTAMYPGITQVQVGQVQVHSILVGTGVGTGG